MHLLTITNNKYLIGIWIGWPDLTPWIITYLENSKNIRKGRTCLKVISTEGCFPNRNEPICCCSTTSVSTKLSWQWDPVTFCKEKYRLTEIFVFLQGAIFSICEKTYQNKADLFMYTWWFSNFSFCQSQTKNFIFRLIF